MSVTLARSWNETLRDQLDFHYRQLFRPRLEGLTDDEYLWEPAPAAWSIRPRGTCDLADPDRRRGPAARRRMPTSPTRLRSPRSPGGSRTSPSSAWRCGP